MNRILQALPWNGTRRRVIYEIEGRYYLATENWQDGQVTKGRYFAPISERGVQYVANGTTLAKARAEWLRELRADLRDGVTVSVIDGPGYTEIPGDEWLAAYERIPDSMLR